MAIRESESRIITGFVNPIAESAAATEEPTSFLNSIAELRNEEEEEENYLINQASSSPALSFQRNFKHEINIREANQTRPLNESSATLSNGDNEPDCGPNGESFGPRNAELAKTLARHYNLQSNTGGSRRPIKEGQPEGNNSSAKLRDLPRPVNLSVLIISWYPPILKLSWNLNELNEAEARKLNFYQNSANLSEAAVNGPAGLNRDANSRTRLNASSAQDDKFLASQFDLELAIEGQPQPVPSAGSGGSKAPDNDQEGLEFNPMNDEDQERLVAEIRARRRLIEESLTCFQVTYNIINSRYVTLDGWRASPLPAMRLAGLAERLKV